MAAHQGFLERRNMSVKVLLSFSILGVKDLEKWNLLFLPVPSPESLLSVQKFFSLPR